MEKRSVQCSSCSHIFEIDLKSRTLIQVTKCPRCLSKFTYDPTKPQEFFEKKEISPKICLIECPACSKGFKVNVPDIQAEQIFTTCPSCKIRFDISEEISKPASDSVQENIPKPIPEPKKESLPEQISEIKQESEGLPPPPKPEFPFDTYEHDLDDDEEHFHEEMEMHDDIRWHEEQDELPEEPPPEFQENLPPYFHGPNESEDLQKEKPPANVQDLDQKEIHWHDDVQTKKNRFSLKKKPGRPRYRKESDRFGGEKRGFSFKNKPSYPKPKKESHGYGKKIIDFFKKPIISVKNFNLHKEISDIKKLFISKNLKKTLKTKTGFAGLLMFVIFILGIVYGILLISDAMGTESYEESSKNTGGLAGLVRNEDGDPINDAYIMAIKGSRKYEAMTNQDGWYLLENLPTGEYSIMVSKENYGTITKKNVIVKPTDTDSTQVETLDFELGTKNKTIYLETDNGLEKNSMMCVNLIFILSILSLLGGLLAIQKKAYKLTSFCAVAGILTIGPILFISAVLGIFALILILSSKEDFG